MGQQLYALLKAPWKTIPRPVRQALTPGGALQPFLVSNVTLPGVLVWTGIGYHALSAGEEERALVADQLASILPPGLLSAHADSRGILLFPDGGEPRRSWRERTSCEKLETEATALGPRGFAWLKVAVPPAQAPDPVGELLMTLPEMVIVELLLARNNGDDDRVRRTLLEHLGRRAFSAIDSAVSAWMKKGSI
jgi:hypothetical protein